MLIPVVDGALTYCYNALDGRIYILPIDFDLILEEYFKIRMPLDGEL